MKIVVFGLSITSAWGNGHASLLRGLFRSLHGMGHEVHFFERDTPYYAANRDAAELPYAKIHLYSDWLENTDKVRRMLSNADVGMVTSYCPDGIHASELVLSSKVARTVFYDMDTPVTLSKLGKGEAVPYIGSRGLSDFDLVLSYTGGDALHQLHDRLGASRVATLYGWVDPDAYHRVAASNKFACDLSYLGTYSADRQAGLERFLIAPAAHLSNRRFVVAGAMYPDSTQWPANILHYDHVPPHEHCGFYSSSPVTLNVTRASMAGLGYCPSGRLFEAAACGTAVVSDWWEGLDTFFEPGEEIVIASSTADSVSAITADRGWLERIGAEAKKRTLDCHTAAIRAKRLMDLIEAPQNERGDGPLACSSPREA